jgi:hypothetical protein
MPEGELLFRLCGSKGLRTARLKTAGVETVVLATVPFVLVHTTDRLEELADRGGQCRAQQGHVREGGRSDRIRPVLVVELLQVVGVFQPFERMKEWVVRPVVLLGFWLRIKLSTYSYWN